MGWNDTGPCTCLASMVISILIGVSYKHSYPHNNRTKSHDPLSNPLGKLRGDVGTFHLFRV